MAWVIVAETPNKANGSRYVKDRKNAKEGYRYMFTNGIRDAKTFFNKTTADEWKEDCGDSTAQLKNIESMGRRVTYN